MNNNVEPGSVITVKKKKDVVSIMGMPIEIIRTGDRARECGASSDGASVLAHQKIFLDMECGKEYAESVFLHEIIEAIDSQCDLQLDHKVLSVLAANLYQALKDNDYLDFNL